MGFRSGLDWLERFHALAWIWGIVSSKLGIGAVGGLIVGAIAIWEKLPLAATLLLALGGFAVSLIIAALRGFVWVIFVRFRQARESATWR